MFWDLYSGQMIPGMDKGVLGMKVGETKSITASPAEVRLALESPSMNIHVSSRMLVYC